MRQEVQHVTRQCSLPPRTITVAVEQDPREAHAMSFDNCGYRSCVISAAYF
jgi:hypothetical protein